MSDHRQPEVALALSGLAAELHASMAGLGIVSPHGHTDPAWFARDAAFANPAELLIQPDHYVFRMLYSRGVALEALGLGGAAADPRDVFRILAEHWHTFLGTPSHLWMADVLWRCFGIGERLRPENATEIYDRIAARIAEPDFRPRALLETFGIEVLATTDGALDDLAHHAAFAALGHGTRLIPTFRPDTVLNPAVPDFAANIDALGAATDCDTGSYAGYLDALRQRRGHFAAHGATATDHDVPHLATEWLGQAGAEELFGRALKGGLSADEATRLYGHLLIEMAQMSLDDGLVMQIHAGSRRGTNRAVEAQFGPNMGADIPHRTDWVGGLDGLLNRVGNRADLTLIAFTLDESAYARELAPMAGHWPALRLGPPWWFHDSVNGILRYFDQVVETAGYENLAGFNDDTRAFLSIPARHDLWRRAVALHLAAQVGRGVMGREDARYLGVRLARGLAIDAYRLGAS